MYDQSSQVLPLISHVKFTRKVMLTNTQFKQLLRTHNIVVVHFSHFATMNFEVEFPDDLQHAIEHFANETRSCCALFPGHKMDLPGAIGLIFDPEIDQVLSVCATDSGSSNYGGKEESLGVRPSEDTILQSLDVRTGTYNEWRVHGSKPVGVYITNPTYIEAKKAFFKEFGDELIKGFACKQISINEVQSAFPELPIFTMEATGLVTLDQ